MKTISDLVNEFGVSRQRIQYIIKQLPDDKKPEKQGRNYIITSEVEEEIRKHIEDARTKFDDEKNMQQQAQQTNIDQVKNENNAKDETSNHHSVIDLTAQIEMLKNELADAKSQLKQETSTVHSMQKLLDQSQQLQLIAQNKLEQIEKKNKELLTTNTKKDVNSVTTEEAPVTNEHQTTSEETRSKKPWWKFW